MKFFQSVKWTDIKVDDASTKQYVTVSKLTHCGRVTQISVFTLQLCKTDDANLRF